jgi:hypothetical protein
MEMLFEQGFVRLLRVYIQVKVIVLEHGASSARLQNGQGVSGIYDHKF